ncbi:translation initiation factor IF-3, mitochondrial-like [Saccoglossus kowalevskii]|uniref:Translation initiation factor IF-3, mitochondrial-like n=1 Tax=Saccoglossus kowalevskii TaxID=10224 RepID=A0ABM0MJR9_SACKO|nr:PREDICTED: translation initiation factor IF-3, mitochondrial-like [Saccoglossus kowalevskii]
MFCVPFYVSSRPLLCLSRRLVFRAQAQIVPFRTFCLVGPDTSNKLNLSRRHCPPYVFIPTTSTMGRGLSSTSEADPPPMAMAEFPEPHADDEEDGLKKKKKKQRVTMGSIGRKIHHKILHLLDENGDSLGPTHRAEAIRLAEWKKLKLIPVNLNAQPDPVYKLMSGQELLKERIRLEEKEKAKKKPTSMKEVKFSGNITDHDLENKKKQIQAWLHKKHHVRVTIFNERRKLQTDWESKEKLIEQILEDVKDVAILNSKAKAFGKDGQDLQCMLRLMSVKEKAQYKKNIKEQEEQVKEVENNTCDDVPK